MEKLKISQFTEKSWESYRALRLESLLDSPDAFGSTYTRELKFSDQEWISRLATNKEIPHLMPLVALWDGKPVGLASGVVHSRQVSTAHIYQMWVMKTHRGLGVGRALVERIEAWARELQLESIALAVTTSNVQAMSLYQSIGFVPCGSPEALRENSNLLVQAMRLELRDTSAQ